MLDTLWTVFKGYFIIQSTDTVKPDVEVHKKTIGSKENIVIEENSVTTLHVYYVFKVMKRTRAPNFRNAEILHLLELVERYPILENKKTDGATTREKQEAWRLLGGQYNATAKMPRTVEALVACYKNQKIKVKKQHSSEKMTIKACTSTLHQEMSKAIVESIEINGQDWDVISQDTNLPPDECKHLFDSLMRQAKKSDSDYIKEVKRTGGGPPPQHPDDLILEKVKNLMGPSLEGMYTMYDGDSQFMAQQQSLLPVEEKIPPIDKFETPKRIVDEEIQKDKSLFLELEDNKEPRLSTMKRLDVLKKKADPSLSATPVKRGFKKPTSQAFSELAEEKKELVKLRMRLSEEELQYQQQKHAIEMETLSENLVFMKKKNELELEFLKEKHKLELEKLKTT